jgi:hypothetical protein
MSDATALASMIQTAHIVEAMADAIEQRMGPLVGSPEYLADPVKCARAEKRRREAAVGHAQAALSTAFPMIMEEAAKVAETRHVHWHMPHPDDAEPGEVCDDISACRDIAAAIRSTGMRVDI